MSLYALQQEIYNYFSGKPVDPQILSSESQDDLSIYRSLIINSMEDLMEKVFPLTYRIIENNWRNIIFDYLQQHLSSSPIFNYLAKDFYVFLASDFFHNKYPDYPNYLAELNLFEWTDLEIYNQKNEIASTLITPIHKILKFKYPITQIMLYLKNTKDPISEIRSTDMEEEPETVCIFRPVQGTDSKSIVLNPGSSFVLYGLAAGKTLDEIYAEFCQKHTIKAGPKIKENFDNLIMSLKKIRLLIH